MKKILLFIFLLPTLAFAQLELPFPIKLVNPKPVDFWYFESDGTPYDNTGEVISQVLSAIRYRGMTFNVNGVEYWFGAGIADVDLVIKSTAMVYPGAGIPISTGSAWGTSITAGAGVETWLTTPSWTNFNSAITGTAPFWKLGGNASTVDGTDFIGTTDNIPFNIRVNNNMAGRIESSSTANTFYGYQTGISANTDNVNTGFGFQVMGSTTGGENTGVGFNALFTNTTGASNTAIGKNSLRLNLSGNDNTAVGVSALNKNSTATGNTAVGRSTLGNATAGYNTAIGGGSLSVVTTGTYNTAIGYGANVSSGSLTNATAIGNGAIVNASNTVQIGNASVTTINMGTSTTAKVVSGGLQITGGTLSSGNVLTSDASGNASWAAPSGGGLTYAQVKAMKFK